MTKQDSIRTKLNNKVFVPYGKSVTLSRLSATTTNTRGETEILSKTVSTINIVPYNIVSNRQTNQSFGVLDSGQMDCAIPYNVTVSTGDLLTIEGYDWKITQIEYNFLPDNVVTIARIQKVQT